MDKWIRQKIHDKKEHPLEIECKKEKKTGFVRKKIFKKPVPKKPFIKRRPFRNSLPADKAGARNSAPARPFQKTSFQKHKLRIIPLGGLEEVGKNMTVLEYGEDIIIIDMGLQFPEEDMLGIDYVVPDISYLEDKKDKIRGVVITHGHLDHIGGIPYLKPKLGNVQFFGTKLTMGLVKDRLKEFELDKDTRLSVIGPDDVLRLGVFNVSFFRVNHSIPDGVGLVISTPVGTIVHTGDFKFDFTPADKTPTDLSKIATLGSKNVVALFSDSTNALKPGYTVSEKQIGETLDEIIKNAEGRIIITSFASLIGRIQQVIDSAIRHKRKVFVSGRSMENSIRSASALGYLKIPPGTVHPVKTANQIGDKNSLVLTTGSQGEAVSALTRMAMSEHAHIKIKRGDTVVLSSSPIIGNERAIATVINNLCKLGAKVISSQIMDVHTSGHAQQEDLKLMINLVKPKYLVPIHGEYYMRMAHAEIGHTLGMREENTILINNGDVLEVGEGQMSRTGEKVEANYVMVEGPEGSGVGSQVLLERQILAENGVLVLLFRVRGRSKDLIGAPDVISRGFIYMKQAPEILEKVTEIAKSAYEEIIKKDKKVKRGDVKCFISSRVNRFVQNKVEKRPLILPVIIGV